MKRINGLILFVVALVMLIFSGPANAVDYVPPFVIDHIYVSGGNNYYLRVFSATTTPHCTGGPAWSYVNENDSGAKAKIASLLMAYSLGKTVSLFTGNDGSGYCQIYEFSVQ